MLVSNDLMLFKKFTPSELPFKRFKEHSYTLLDASEGSIFLHVNHYGDDSKFGNIYISDFSGTRFSSSLLHNVRDSEGQTDFDKIQGLDGIYLANVYDVEYTNQYLKTKNQQSKKQKSQKNRVDQSFKKTFISFDKGGVWKSLKSPDQDSSGQKYECEDTECFLHLHSVTSSKFGPFYSTKSAIGLIVGVGNVGKHLSNDEDEVSTFLSRDGGLTWEEIRKGSHVYEIGDHGALIVMAYDQKATNQVFFSWNEGLSWESLKFSEEKIHVTNIIVDPLSISQNFLLYGRKGEKGVVVALDFSSLHEPQCKGVETPGQEGSDYELWTPNDGRVTQKCLLGKTIEYTRRKREAECYNGETFERKQFLTTCECEESDWECDIGYYRKESNGPCEKVPDSKASSLPENVEEYCKSTKSSYYLVSQGYRKIPGDLCNGGITHDAVFVPCPGQSAWSTIGSSVLILFMIIFLIYCIANNFDKLAKFYESIVGSKGKWLDRQKLNRSNYTKDFNTVPETAEEEGQIASKELENQEEEEDPDEESSMQANQRQNIKSASKQVPKILSPNQPKREELLLEEDT